MGRRKATAKSKATARKPTQSADTAQTIKATSKIKDDPGGTASARKVVRAAHNKPDSTTNAVSHSNKQQLTAPSSPVAVMAPTSTASVAAAAVVLPVMANKSPVVATAKSDAVVAEPNFVATPVASPAASTAVDHNKYLHKKFKRVASLVPASADAYVAGPLPTNTMVVHNGIGGASAAAAVKENSVPNGHHNGHVTMPITNGEMLLSSSKSLPHQQPTMKLSANSNGIVATATMADSDEPHYQSRHRENGKIGMVAQPFNGNADSGGPVVIPATATAVSTNHYSGAYATSATTPLHHNNNDHHHYNQNGAAVGMSVPADALTVAYALQQQQHAQMQQQQQMYQLLQQSIVVDELRSQQQQFMQQQQQPSLSSPSQSAASSASSSVKGASSAVAAVVAQPQSSKSPTPGRYVCPYCSLNCAKPSVLQKHIRAHTNERPYPCDLCGFAFKTRSNLYKHCRSRAHALRLQGHEPQPDDETSMGSDPEQDLSSSASSDVQFSRTASPMDDRVSSPSCQPQQPLQSAAATASQSPFASSGQSAASTDSVSKPYKPKFHNASLYAKEDVPPPQLLQHALQQQPAKATAHPTPHLTVSLPLVAAVQVQQSPLLTPLNGIASAMSTPPCGTPTSGIMHPLTTQNVEYLKEHISKIISQNEAIMEVVEPALQKKYHKITGISRGIENTSSKLAMAMLKQREEASAVAAAAVAATLTPSTNAHASTSTASHSAIASSQSSATTVNSSTAAAPSTSGQTPRRALPTLQQHAQQVLQSQAATLAALATTSAASPLNLSNALQSDQAAADRKRSYSDSLGNNSAQVGGSASSSSTANAGGEPTTNTHPQNPERSIIKDLLLNSRGLAVPSGGEGDDAIYTCPLCKINFPSADNLQYHTQQCQGARSSNASPQSAPISPVGSPSHKYFRSASFHAHLPEKYNPNTLAKLASSTIKHPYKTPLSLAKLAKIRLKPDNIIITMDMCPAPVPLEIVAPAGSAANAPVASTSRQSVSAQCAQITRLIEVDTPLPSPGPLLGKTRLVDSFSCSATSDRHQPEVEAIVSHFTDTNESGFRKLQTQTPPETSANYATNASTSSKRSRLSAVTSDASSIYSPSALQPSSASISVPTTPLHIQRMSGGDIKIVDTRQSDPRLDTVNAAYQHHSSHSHLQPQPSPSAHHTDMSPNALRMCGGDFKIVERRPDGRHEPHFGSSGGSIVSISPSPPGSMHMHQHTYHPSHMRSPMVDVVSLQQHLHQQHQQQHQQQQHQQQQQHHLQHGLLQPQHGLLTPKYLMTSQPPSTPLPYFQFPPSGLSHPAIVGYNPLSLPLQSALVNMQQHSSSTPAGSHAAQIVHGGKIIPFVPGMPGPNTALLSPKPEPKHRVPSPNQRRMIPSPLSLQPAGSGAFSQPKQSQTSPARNIPSIRVLLPQDVDVEMMSVKRPMAVVQQPLPKNGQMSGYAAHSGPVQHHTIWPPATAAVAKPMPEPKKRFNFSRMADNLSPKKVDPATAALACTGNADSEYRYFNFEKPDAGQQQSTPNHLPQLSNNPRPTTADTRPRHLSSPLHIDVSSAPQQQPAKSTDANLLPPPPSPHHSTTPSAAPSAQQRRAFLRPSSLPLKPGTFTPKRHHGITPTANTLPLISPETPRPSKNCVQLYHNGHAYTYLGLKCSTKTFYCTVNRPQPVHFTNQHKLSIYSNWQVCAESNPHPLNLTPKVAMSLYDSRQRPTTRVATASMGPTCTILHSQSLHIAAQVNAVADATTADQRGNRSQQLYAANSQLAVDRSAAAAATASQLDGSTAAAGGDSAADAAAITPVPGGYESLEDYTYVRGRGRGKYVCSECGIRCKKPSMLKKHIRTHTDVRPYRCAHCSFSFKTKGNLTKHMKSKAHFKKCKELGLNPMDGLDQLDIDDIEGESVTSGDHTSTMPGDEESDSDDMMSDGEGGYSTDNDESRMPEHEAAKSLLFLSQTPSSHSTPNLIPGRPMTYPYAGDFMAALEQQKLEQQRLEQQQLEKQQLEQQQLEKQQLEKQQLERKQLLEQQQQNQQQLQHMQHESQPLQQHLPVESHQNYPNQSQQHYQQHYQQPSIVPASPAVRRSISFVPPDFQPIIIKQEQYYANPKISMSPKLSSTALAYRAAPNCTEAAADASIDSAMPMDLTIPRTPATTMPAELSKSPAPFVRQLLPQQHPRFADVVNVHSGPAGLLSSLVSITDKLPTILASPGQHQNRHSHLDHAQEAATDLLNSQRFIHEHGKQNALLQTYLTERAMHDTRIKQGQMYRDTTATGAFATTLSSTTSTTITSSSMSSYGIGLRPMTSNGLLMAADPPVSVTRQYTSNQTSASHVVPTAAVLTTPTTSTGSTTSSVAAPRLTELHVHTSFAATTIITNPFDALKNSPNASKVTYAAKPSNPIAATAAAAAPDATASAAAVVWSLKPIDSPAALLVKTMLTAPPTASPASVDASSVVEDMSNDIDRTKLTITVTESPLDKSLACVTGTICGMDTLADIAASSVKLDTSSLTQAPLQLPAITVKVPAEINAQQQQLLQQPEAASGTPLIVPVSTSVLLAVPAAAQLAPSTAQSVATEYLKRTSVEYIRTHLASDRSDATETSTTTTNTITTDDEDQSDGEQPAVLAISAAAAVAAPPTAAVNLDSSNVAAIGTSAVARTVVVGEDGFQPTASTTSVTAPTSSSAAESTTAATTSSGTSTSTKSTTSHRGFIQEDGRSVCTICAKTFPRKHQMILHMNIHYMERKFRCEPCAVAFRTHGTLQKHERGDEHKQKVLLASTYGVPTTANPRPFECADCKVAFRIHGHLAKHLRSKTHVQKLECLQKLPFGTYAEMERAAISLTEIDTTDCENSLASLRVLAQRLFEREPAKLVGVWPPAGVGSEASGSGISSGSETGDDGGEAIVPNAEEMDGDVTIKRKASAAGLEEDALELGGGEVEKRVRLSAEV